MRVLRSISKVIVSSTLVLTLFSGTALAANLGDRLLSVGSRGDDVYQLQQELQVKGYFTATPTGYYGEVTRQAVRDFQSAAGISADGIAGPQTFGKLSTEVATSTNGHTVAPGESLWALAKRYQTTVTAIKSLNGLTGDTIYVGQKLQIPESQAAVTPSEQQNSTSSRGSDVSREDVLLLARMIEAEAGGESYNGKLAVGAVIVNRTKSPDFPNDIKGVIYQTGQFSPVSDGRLWQVTISSDSQKAAEQALAGVDPTGGATFFFNPSKSSSTFMHSRPVITQIGGHVFTR